MGYLIFCCQNVATEDYLLNCFLCFVVVAPILHGHQNWTHGFAKLGEGVFDAGRNLGVDGAGDDAVGLHLTEALRQHFLTDSVQTLVQLVEAPRAYQKIPDDQEFPFVSDKLYRGGHRAIRKFVFCFHGETLHYFQIECCSNIVLQHFLFFKQFSAYLQKGAYLRGGSDAHIISSDQKLKGVRRTGEMFTFALEVGTDKNRMAASQMEDVFFNCLDFCELNRKTAHFFLRGDDPARYPELWHTLELFREEAVSFTLLSEPEKTVFELGCPKTNPENQFDIQQDGSVFWRGRLLGNIFEDRLADLWAVSGCCRM